MRRLFEHVAEVVFVPLELHVDTLNCITHFDKDFL
jgi:hypothetical protein